MPPREPDSMDLGVPLQPVQAQPFRSQAMIAGEDVSEHSVPILGEEMQRQHREIFDALDAVLDLYHRGGGSAQLSAALDDLVERTRSHFRDEESTSERGGQGRSTAHLEAHRLILEYMMGLRRNVEHCDRVRFLPKLRFVDYWLTTHVSEESVRLI